MHLEANVNTKEGVSIRTVEQKLICFQFHNEKDQAKVLEACLWFFDNNLLILIEVPKGAQRYELEF